MAIPSFDAGWRQRENIKPRIVVLEIRDRARVGEPPIGWVIVEREEV